jgi:hypothetical protein
MRLEKVVDAQGQYYVRRAFVANDYRVDRNSMRAIEAWRDDRLPTQALLEMRDGPFAGWRELSRFVRDGEPWARFYHPSGEYGVEVELVEAGLGKIVELDPKLAYDLAVENDRQRTDVRILHE